MGCSYHLVVCDERCMSHVASPAPPSSSLFNRRPGDQPPKPVRRTVSRCVEVFAHGEARFSQWMESDAAAAEAQLSDAVAAPGAWQAVEWKVHYSELCYI